MTKHKALILLFLGWSAPLWAENSQPSAYPEKFTPREHAWSLGATVKRLDIHTEHYQLNALAPYIDIGRGWVRSSWWSLVELSLVLGPSGERVPESPPLDFTGTGLRFRFGHAMPGRLLRQDSGDWGLELGLEYNEWIARSYQNKKLDDDTISNSWVVRSRWIFVQPALFYSLWKSGRPQGHKPEWVTTRIEGVVFSLGLSFPIQAQMQASYNKAGEKQSVTDHWQGTLAFLSLTTWLGI